MTAAIRLPFDRRARAALIALCVTLVVGGIGFKSVARMLNVYLTKEPVDLRSHFDNIPSRLPKWEAVGEPAKLTEEMVEELGTDKYLDRRYKREDGDVQFGLHLAYYTGMIDAVPHVPDRCLVAAGFNARSTPQNIEMAIDRTQWAPDTDPPGGASAGGLRDSVVTFHDAITRTPVTVRMPRGDFALRTTEFSHKDMPNARIYAGYFFIANGRVAVTPEDVKLLAFNKTERYAYYCKVQMSLVGDESLTAEHFVEHAASLLDEVLPELMRCLPDWATIEAETTLANAS